MQPWQSLENLFHRAATSALGTYGAYVGYGLLHRDLRHPHRGPEAVDPLPGDDLVSAPDSTKTFVVDIAAPPAAVWPYLIQMADHASRRAGGAGRDAAPRRRACASDLLDQHLRALACSHAVTVNAPLLPAPPADRRPRHRLPPAPRSSPVEPVHP